MDPPLVYYAFAILCDCLLVEWQKCLICINFLSLILISIQSSDVLGIVLFLQCFFDVFLLLDDLQLQRSIRKQDASVLCAVPLVWPGEDEHIVLFYLFCGGFVLAPAISEVNMQMYVYKCEEWIRTAKTNIFSSSAFS